MKEFRVLQHIISCQQSQALNNPTPPPPPPRPLLVFLLTNLAICPSSDFLKVKRTTRLLWASHYKKNCEIIIIVLFKINCLGGFEHLTLQLHHMHVSEKVVDEWSGDDFIIEVAPFQSDVCDDTGH